MIRTNKYINPLFFALILLLNSCLKQEQEADTEHRIVSVAPAITEIVYALQLEDQLLAVSDYCYFPPRVKQKEKIGGLFNPNLEKITALQPTLILATKSNRQLGEKFTDRNIKVVLLPENTVEDIFISIDSIGTLTGKKEIAENLISAIKDSLLTYTNTNNYPKPTAILVLGREQGSTRNIGISGPGAFINELWELCGGLNAFPDMPGSYSQINREDILARDPRIIIEIKSSEVWDEKQQQKNLNEWKDLEISAVKNGNIFVIADVNMLVPGPRIYLLAKRYAQILKNYK
jgi:iron complex transport system substrate-binding protein